jgi:hypothetical protein
MEKCFKIGGVYWKVKSNICINGYFNDRFSKFISTQEKCNLIQDIECLKERPEFSVSSNEVKKLVENNPYKISGNINSSQLRNSKIFNFLDQTKKHAAYQTIDIKEFSISIFDFRNNVIKTYCLPELKDILMKSRIGHFFLSIFLHKFNSVLIHSSAVVINNKAFIFVAHDEGGKTTIAELFNNTEAIISDDQNLLKWENDQYFCYSTPWGMYQDPLKRVKVAGFFMLTKGGEFSISEYSSNIFFAYMCQEHYTNHSYLPTKELKTYFKILSDICSRYPVYKLQFRKDYVDWDAIAAVMK